MPFLLLGLHPLTPFAPGTTSSLVPILSVISRPLEIANQLDPFLVALLFAIDMLPGICSQTKHNHHQEAHFVDSAHSDDVKNNDRAGLQQGDQEDRTEEEHASK